MLGLFRKIRRKLLSEGGYPMYILYASGEILLVMVGILLALQVDNWNDNRKLRIQEYTLLEDLQEDILADTADLVFNIKLHRLILKEEKALLEYMFQEGTMPEDGIDFAIALGIPIATVLHQSAFNSVQSSDPDLVTNNELKKKISRHYNFFAGAVLLIENELDAYKLYNLKLSHFLTHFRTMKETTAISFSELETDEYISPDMILNKLEIKDRKAFLQDDAFKTVISRCILLREIELEFLEDFLDRIYSLDTEIEKEILKMNKS